MNLDPFSWWRARRRRKLLATPVPASWQPILDGLPFFARLTPAEQATLRGTARVLIAEKSWEGCGGLALTDRIRVTIAAQAALLLLHLEHDYYRGLQSILVYPHAFVDPMPWVTESGVVTQGIANHGEAWRRGPVVLDWDEARAGVARPDDGRNLVLHEFAHKLDMLDGFADGCPPLHGRAAYRAWHEVMSREYQALCDADEHGRATLLDAYGTTNPAEFFAVATECFFEQGPALAARHPAMYALLRDYYGQDPAAR